MGLKENIHFERKVQAGLGEDPNREEDPNIGEFNSQMRKKWAGDKPQLEEFMSEEEVEEAWGEINEIKKNFSERTMESIAAEYITMEGIYEHLWLSEKQSEKPGETAEVYVLPTSEYDDIKNGTDLVVAIKKPDGEWMYLAIDVTTAEDPEEIRVKLEKTTSQIRKGKLPHIDHYSSSDSPDDYKGPLDLPRVVIGIDKEKVGGLANDFLNNKGALPEHEIQLELNQEIIDQLTTAIEIIVNRHILATAQGVGKLSHIQQAERDFKNPKEALDLVEEVNSGENFPRITTEVSQTLNRHAEMLKYMLEVQKEKSSLGEIPPERAQNSLVFRKLAPRKTRELLEAA